MKRIILEWSLVFLIGMALAMLTVWAGSRFLDRSTYHLRIATSRSVQDDLHVLVANGDLALCDQFAVDAAGNVRPLIINARNVLPADIRRAHVSEASRYRDWKPGIIGSRATAT